MPRRSFLPSTDKILLFDLNDKWVRFMDMQCPADVFDAPTLEEAVNFVKVLVPDLTCDGYILTFCGKDDRTADFLFARA